MPFLGQVLESLLSDPEGGWTLGWVYCSLAWGLLKEGCRSYSL